MLEKIKRVLRSYAFEGIILIIIGIYMLFNPSEALGTLCTVIGIILTVIGALRVISFFADKNGNRVPQDLITGIIMLGFGITLIAAPGTLQKLLQIVIGIVVIYGSALILTECWMRRKEGGKKLALMLALGIITLVLGIVTIANHAVVASMVRICGISLIVEGFSIVLTLAGINKKAGFLRK